MDDFRKLELVIPEFEDEWSEKSLKIIALAKNRSLWDKSLGEYIGPIT